MKWARSTGAIRIELRMRLLASVVTLGVGVLAAVCCPEPSALRMRAAIVSVQFVLLANHRIFRFAGDALFSKRAVALSQDQRR